MTVVTSSHDDASAASLTVAAIPMRNRPKGMKGFVYDYIASTLGRLKDGEHLEPILTSDVWYDLTDENRNSKWAGMPAKFFKQKYGFSINLRYLGTDISIIEKEGIAKVLSPLAADSGIALLSTRGFLTENALDLSVFAQKSGANVATLTDCDISGYVIAHKVPNVPRLGIDFKSLEDLDILEDLREGEYYSPDKGHLKYAQQNIEGFDLERLDFLKTRRIEINAVKNKVGAKGLWNWIFDKLEEIYPNGITTVQ
jgi:hypothetical protein